MAINYSLSYRYKTPGNATSGRKVYPHAQSKATLDINTFAKHITQHGSSYSRATVAAVLTEAVDCLREELLLGNSVELGDMGKFYVHLQSTGAENTVDFTSSDITKLNVRWSPSDSFKNLLKEAEFNYVPTREAQYEAGIRDKERVDMAVAEANGLTETETVDNPSVEE